MTHRDAYPLPRIDATLESLAGSKLFSTLDLAAGYWQVEVEEEDKNKTAFSTMQGHFEFNVMPFGLTNAPATFQRLMECTLAGLTPAECLIYLDDIVVFSSTFEDHLHRLKQVFERLRRTGLRLKPSKCHFCLPQVKYLGHIVSAKGIQPDSAKLEAVTKYPTPRNIEELRAFLGLANYYRRFVQSYAHIAGPLYNLTRKSIAGYKWTECCEESFVQLKQALTSPPILAYPKFDTMFTVSMDASDTAMGAVLSQIQEGKERVIAYWSRQLDKAQRHYSTIEREALAVVSAIKEFYPYLYGFKFELVTDHNPLISLKGLHNVGGRITRWILFLQQFDFTIVYKLGRSNGNADALSRVPGVEKHLVNVISGLDVLGDQDQIRKFQRDDEVIARTIQAIERNINLPQQLAKLKKELVVKNGVLCRCFQATKGDNPFWQVVVPVTLRDSVLKKLHDESGHLGLKKTLSKIQERVYWTGYEDDVRRWIQECGLCQRGMLPNPQQLHHWAPSALKSHFKS